MLRLEGHANIARALRACTWDTPQLLAKLGIVKKVSGPAPLIQLFSHTDYKNLQPR